jgi:hypothetical protein
MQVLKDNQHRAGARQPLHQAKHQLQQLRP